MLMTRRFCVVFSFCILFPWLFNPLSWAQSSGNSNVCALQQCVKLQNGYLWVLSSDNTNYVPYFIKAVGYQPTPIGRYPTDFGYPPSDPRSINNNIYDDPNILTRDFSLLAQMNANTIRIWNGAKTTVSCQCANNGRYPDYMTNAATTANSDTTQNTLDLAASYGLKVIAGFWINPLIFDANNNVSTTDGNGNILTRQDIINNFVNYVNTFKSNRSILFWAIGNENNYEVINGQPVPISAFESVFGVSYGDTIYNWLRQTGNFLDYNGDILVDLTSPVMVNILIEQYPLDYNSILNVLKSYSGQVWSPQQLAAWYGLVDAMALAAHNAEGADFHPVALVNGEIATIGNEADGSTDAQMPDLDIWGANIYRGQSFGTLFSDYRAKSSKPFWISEYGIDAWSVSSAVNINDWGMTLSDDLGGTGYVDAYHQSLWDLSLWNEILNNAAVTIGGSVMEYSDEWWKPNEFYCSNPSSSQADNTISTGICNSNQKYFGFPNFPSPDGISNEEWYGIMSISPNPVAGKPDVMTPRDVYTGFQSAWQANPWATLTLNISGTGSGTISSPASLGEGLNCRFSSGSSTGNCTAAFSNNQPVTLTFTPGNNSTITNWGTSACANGANSCVITPAGAVSLNVTISSLHSPVVTLNSYIYAFTAPAVDYLVASASEASGSIAKVEFYNGAALIDTETLPQAGTSLYGFLWFNLSPGNYNLTAKAYDSLNNASFSAPVNFTVHGLPTVGLSASASTANAPASIVLTANAAESFGSIAQVNFYNGTTLLGTSTASPFTFSWNNVPAGNYNLTAVATDSFGATATSSAVSVTVNSAGLAPSVTLNSYIYSYMAPAVDYMVATATETGGAIVKVEFYNGTTLLDTQTVPQWGTSQYDFLFFNLTAGTYNLTAKAYDSNNQVATSAPVNFTVT